MALLFYCETYYGIGSISVSYNFLFYLSIVFMESIPHFFILLLLFVFYVRRLNKATGKRQSPPFRVIRKEGDIISTYEEFMI